MALDIELILARQLASYLATPIFIVDPHGTLLFYNEPAELILGCRFDETGEMTAAEWGTAFLPVDEEGVELPREDLPLTIAFREGHPAHRDFWIHGFDQVRRHIEVTAFPIIGQANGTLGALAIFWEVEGESDTVGHTGLRRRART
jgi:PAS domain-containing protein